MIVNMIDLRMLICFIITLIAGAFGVRYCPAAYQYLLGVFFGGLGVGFLDRMIISFSEEDVKEILKDLEGEPDNDEDNE